MAFRIEQTPPYFNQKILVSTYDDSLLSMYRFLMASNSRCIYWKNYCMYLHAEMLSLDEHPVLCIVDLLSQVI